MAGEARAMLGERAFSRVLLHWRSRVPQNCPGWTFKRWRGPTGDVHPSPPDFDGEGRVVVDAMTMSFSSVVTPAAAHARRSTQRRWGNDAPFRSTSTCGRERQRPWRTWARCGGSLPPPRPAHYLVVKCRQRLATSTPDRLSARYLSFVRGAQAPTVHLAGPNHRISASTRPRMTVPISSTAEFTGMSEAAVGTGRVDFVSPANIGLRRSHPG
jgi:hypothetical protein